MTRAVSGAEYAALSSESPSPVDPSRTAAEPPAESVRLALRVLLHLGPTPAPSEGVVVAPFPATQEGIAERLEVTQGAVSKVLVRLVAAGVVRQESGHVNGFVRRVRVYSLTDRGAALVRAYHERFGMTDIGNGGSPAGR